jgi:hypothetical protein
VNLRQLSGSAINDFNVAKWRKADVELSTVG